MNRAGGRSAAVVLAGAVMSASVWWSGATAVADDGAGEAFAAPPAVAALGVVERAVPLEESPVDRLDVASGQVGLDLGPAGGVTVQLPTAGGGSGKYVAGAADPYGVAVVPTQGGVQLVVDIDAGESPEVFDFDVDLPDGFAPELTEDGAVVLRDATGAELAYVEQPWAYDAAGAPVPTRFEVDGATIAQVVEHRGAGFAYPITADPKIKGCNWQTATCVTFSKSETRRIASQTTNAAGVGALCGLLPHALIRVGCGAAFVPIWNSVKSTFNKAKREGRCVEVKLNRLPPAYNLPIGWKVVNC
ncbi:MAG TPA: hypothetical protein VGE77_05905 [Nocardioides sp.]